MYLSHDLRKDFHYLSLRSSLLEELSLLYGMNLSAGENRTGRLCRCRRMTRDFLSAWRCQPECPEYPYFLGILLERAGQLALTGRPRWAYDQAERYYDQARQLQALRPPGTYDRRQYLRPAVALLRLSLRRRQEERFYAWWDRCGGLRCFHRDVQALFQVRWLIVKEDYDRAAFQLRELHGLAGRNSAFSPARARILSDIVTAARHGPGAALRGAYGPYVRQVLWKALFPARRDK
ncbi:MAG: hypothetical protein MSS75_02070 [Megasphaera sp.]|uniref:hypothetical protein n=1 Tax=Megasphaera sp. TaxID=2023260 RepID=UPI0025C44061|nr:hypothetical protein [Megasphaera sp.]MCF0151815.1 hypothetical protein [Megasphaera sp.]MCI7599826.1 hypothetical protein [Megasphaera sp.]